MSQNNQIEKLLQTILPNLGHSSAEMQQIGIERVMLVSPRTIRMDIKDGKSVNGVNRIKVTLQENGELRIRTAKYEELEDVPNIAPVNLLEALKTFGGVGA